MSKVTLANGNRTIEEYDSLQGTHVDFRSPEFANQKPKMYVWLNRAQFDLIEVPENATQEERSKLIRKEAIKMRREVAREAGFNMKEWGFSQNAGCSCGCSPGFIYRGDEWLPYGDVHVTQFEEITQV